MPLPVDGVIEHTLTVMQKRIEQKINSGALAHENRLVFMGNVHDAFPRQLFLDSRLSPLDKMAWIMLRLSAQQNENAIFPSYDDLQIQLASPHSEQASRETVSRVLLMLRLTGWISLCKRVRDKQGCIRGNIYAQHDEPLSFKDCEVFDPDWVNLVASSCNHGNKLIRLTALSILEELKADNTMRHRHSRLALIEARLSAPQTTQQFVKLNHARNRTESNQPGSDIELCHLPLSSESELSNQTPGSDSEPSDKPCNIKAVRNPNSYVRSNIRNNNTYVVQWPESLNRSVSDEDKAMLTIKLESLPEQLGRAVLADTDIRFRKGQVNNPTGYLIANIKRAQAGSFNLTIPNEPISVTAAQQLIQINTAPIQKASRTDTQAMMAEIRALLNG